MAWSLRPARFEDHEVITDLMLRSRAAFLPYAPWAHSQEDVQVWVRDYLLATGGVTVAEKDGRVVGMVATLDDGRHRWIDQMYVAPEAVGQGVGTALLQDALTRLRPPVRLYVFLANTKARRLYERHGFVLRKVTDGRGNEERCPDALYER